jgi:hypothetical protein
MPELTTKTISTERGPMSIVTQPMPPLALPRQAPEVPAGWEIGPPDFVGVGTARSGTTWWWNLLIRHPGYARTEAFKEVHYFDHYQGVQAVDPVGYHRYFPRPPGRLSGEWTPRYMYDYWTPPMLQQAAPDAKLLVMLRDPVERMLSNLALSLSRGIPVSQTLLHQQYERGLYGAQLTALHRYFPAARILVLQYERCVTDPVGEMRRTLEFLGLDPDRWDTAHAQRRVNSSQVEKPALDPDTRAALVGAFQADLVTLQGLAPGLDLALWPTAAASSTVLPGRSVR